MRGSDFKRVDPVTNGTDQRGGILSHASVLTVSSYPTRTSVVIRGKYILNNILGAASAASARRPENRRRIGGRHRVAGGKWKSIARTRCAPPATTRWTRWASGWRTTTASASGARRRQKFPVDSSGAPWKVVPDPGPDARALLMAALPHSRASPDGEDADVCTGRGLRRRPAHGGWN